MKLNLILSALVLTFGLVSCSKSTDTSSDVDTGDTATDVATLPEDSTAVDAADVVTATDVTATDAADVTATDVKDAK